MLARCIGSADAEKYFGAVEAMFKQQAQLMDRTTDTLKAIGKLNGMSEQEGRDLREGSSLARQARCRSKICACNAEGRFNADLLRQRRETYGRDVVRGARG
jgi:hypothetical protein